MPAKILVADDDLMLQRLISNTLKLENHQIILAENGQQALDLTHAEQPDLIILDVMMPQMNGFDVCKALRSDPSTATLPVIMLSGLGQVQERITGLKAGADEYLTKPIDPRELLTRVEMLLARHRVLRQSAATKTGRVLSVIGAKGGVGTTTLAVNLAAQLALGRKNTILYELRPDFGTVSVQLHLTPQLSLATLRDYEASAITEQAVSRLLIRTEHDFRVVCGPQKAAEFGSFSAGIGGAVLSRLTALAEYVVIDLPPGADPATEAVIKSSDHVIVTLEPELTSVAAAVHRLQQIADYGPTISSHAVVVNRQGGMLLSLREIERRLGRTVKYVIPPATDTMSIAIQYGSPLVISQPHHVYAENIIDIVHELTDGAAVRVATH